MKRQVRLVIKAPNQQIEDQMVECTSEWTVRKLKGHLSETYPSKPKVEEQKLIYSGQLLHDHMILQDVLRQYEDERLHTVHLVCLPPRDDAQTIARDVLLRNPTNSSSNRTNDTLSSAPIQLASEDGLRHRNGLAENTVSSNSTARQIPFQQLPYTLPNLATSQAPSDLGAQQLAWMQQWYHQYMNIYLQQYHARLPESNSNLSTTEVPQPVTVTPPDVQPANPDEAREIRDPPNIRLNAQGGIIDGNDDDEAGGNWDWLDWFYVWCRAAVLFSLVYFYSSFNRFVLVMIFAAFMYLFRRRANHRRPQAPVRPPAEQPAPQARNEEHRDEPGENEEERMQRETREIEELMNRDLDDAGQVQNRRAASLVHIAWTFVATFFQSLLPEQPDPFNLN